MDLADVFSAVRPSIVALASRVVQHSDPGEPLLPAFVGTAFFVDKRGLLLTNRHVVEALLNLPPIPKSCEPAAIALVPTGIQTGNSGHIGRVVVATIRGYWPLASFQAPTVYYGDPLPDLGFVQLNVKDVPSLELAEEPWAVRVGSSVATAGFPLGDAALTAYRSVNQITPFLRHGIISSVLPFPCPHPHGFTVDIQSQGGASGSPIFLSNSPRVVGLLHAAFDGTNLTFAVPSQILKAAFDSFLGSVSLDLEGVLTLQELTANASEAVE